MSEAPTGSRENRWLSERSERWQAIADELPALADSKPLSIDQVRAALRHYPELARDLAIARDASAASRLTAHLEYLYTGLHRAIFRPHKAKLTSLNQLFRRDIPAAAYELRWSIFSVSIGFLLAGLAGWWLVQTYPELAALVASREMIDTLQEGELWTDGLLNIIPPSVLSVQIFANNIMVALTAMSLGVLYGLGTIYIIGLNGLMIGGVFALTHQHDMAGRLFEFVCAHGFVELSIIAISAAVGFSIGESLARPGRLPRLVAFQRAVQRGARLMVLCVLFLVGAGIIEGYVSPNPNYDLTSRLLIGIAYWVLMIWALFGWPLPRRTGASSKPAAGI
ncbi:MAG: stage II sporulation protein M [Pseudomonadota bacterium]